MDVQRTSFFRGLSQQDAIAAAARDETGAAALGFTEISRSWGQDKQGSFLSVSYAQTGKDGTQSYQKCPNCRFPFAGGTVIHVCPQCGYKFGPRTGGPGLDATTIRIYTGDQQTTAVAFQGDAAGLAALGYAPISQSYAPGQHGTSSYVIAVLLIFVGGLGLIVLGYLLIVKPPGTLTVTYRKDAPTTAVPTAAVPPVASVPNLSLVDGLRQIDEARVAGVLTDDEHAAKKAELLARL